MGAAQAEMFDLPQPDLFGAPTAPAYVVPHAIAVNTLRKTLATLTAAERWPWDPDMKVARMDRTVPNCWPSCPPKRPRTGAVASRPRPRGWTPPDLHPPLTTTAHP